MKKSNLSAATLVVVMATYFTPGFALASHELGNADTAPLSPSDGHMSWHEFRHELGMYPSINATIDHHGVITLSGHVESATDSNAIMKMARKIRGASDVQNNINVD